MLQPCRAELENYALREQLAAHRSAADIALAAERAAAEALAAERAAAVAAVEALAAERAVAAEAVAALQSRDAELARLRVGAPLNSAVLAQRAAAAEAAVAAEAAARQSAEAEVARLRVGAPSNSALVCAPPSLRLCRAILSFSRAQAELAAARHASPPSSEAGSSRTPAPGAEVEPEVSCAPPLPHSARQAVYGFSAAPHSPARHHVRSNDLHLAAGHNSTH